MWWNHVNLRAQSKFRTGVGKAKEPSAAILLHLTERGSAKWGALYSYL